MRPGNLPSGDLGSEELPSGNSGVPAPRRSGAHRAATRPVLAGRPPAPLTDAPWATSPDVLRAVLAGLRAVPGAGPAGRARPRGAAATRWAATRWSALDWDVVRSEAVTTAAAALVAVLLVALLTLALAAG
ncbi:hypothetical protein GTR02_21490 [Kineococcus sp. R8]|nr:hypothetical protein [Kineococcus siccus]